MTQSQDSSLSSSLKRCAYLSGLAAALLGLLLSVYLSAQHTRLKSGIQESSSFCTLGKYADCDVVSASPFSEVLGIPIASVGAVYYFFALLLLMWASPSRPGSARLWRGITWLSLVALIVDVGLGVIQIAVIQSVCLLCALTYLCTAVIFLTAAQLQASKRLKANTVFAEGLFSAQTGPQPSLAALGMILIATVLAAGSLYMLPQYIRMNLRTNSMDGFFASWKEREPRKIPVVSTDAVMGSPTAKMQIVEFSDFECPHCKRAAFALHTFLKTKGDKVQFVFKNFPLDNACNGLLERPMHKNACALARLGRCANSKGKFKEFHDAVFFELSDDLQVGGSQTLLDAVKNGVLKPIFSEEEFHTCLSDSGTLQIIKDDIQQGVDLGVKGTPAIFINGHSVPIQITLENLNTFFEIEEKR